MLENQNNENKVQDSSIVDNKSKEIAGNVYSLKEKIMNLKTCNKKRLTISIVFLLLMIVSIL